MPVYEYECTNCHHHFDKMQKISDPPIEQCPHCEKNTVIKLMSATSFQLKGTGWYATDFKNKESSTKKSDQTDTTNTEKTAAKESTAAPVESKTDATKKDKTGTST